MKKFCSFLGSTSSLVVLLAQLTGKAATFTADAVIDPFDTSFDGQDVIVTNCTLRVDGSHAFASVHLLNGARLTHLYSPTGSQTYYRYFNGEPHVLSVTNPAVLVGTGVLTNTVLVADALHTTTYVLGTDYSLEMTNDLTQILRVAGSTIPEGSTISVDYEAVASVPTGLALTVSNDLEIEVGGLIDVTGNGYGLGFGPGAGSLAVTNFPYPFSAGSGGGHGGPGGASAAGAPGGASYDSVIQPNDKGGCGGSGAGVGANGGGLVRLTVGGLLRVDGVIAADGLSATNARSGGGGGGSISLTFAVLSGAGSISANGGAGEPFAGGGGGAGRISLRILDPQAPNPLPFTGTVSAYGGPGATAGGAGTIFTYTPDLSGDLVLLDNHGRSGSATPVLAPGIFALTIAGGAIVSPLGPTTLSQLTIQSNSWLLTQPGQVLNLIISKDAVIAPGGGITAAGRGYLAALGSGAGHSGTYSNIIVGSGGGYGGAGGAAGRGISGGGSYGSITAPTLLGSGGGPGVSVGGLSAIGGAGGGAILFTVNGTLDLGGRITADGTGGEGPGAGGGSGGSVSLTVGRFAGAGAVSANGGAADLPWGGGGGGGRIALSYLTNQFTGTLAAHGGLGVTNGAAGTIYLKSTAGNGPPPQLVIDNGGLSQGTNTILLVGNTYDLVISGGASASPQFQGLLTLRTLLVGSGSWLRFPTLSSSTSLTVSSNATIQAGGGIVLDGAGAAPGAGPGPGHSASSIYGLLGSGGGHGGYGGASLTNNPGGNSYDTLFEPNLVGSGGGNGAGSSPFNLGGTGGGALQMTVTGTLLLDGKLSANGTVGIGQGSGGGSGGSLRLTLGKLTGAGSISVNGGSGDLPWGGGGAGGRISIVVSQNQFIGTLTAYGGAGANFGGAGTIYVRTGLGSTSGFVMVDNGGFACTNTLVSIANLSPPVSLTVEGGAQAILVGPISAPTLANVFIGPNSWLTFSNFTTVGIPLRVTSNVVIQAGGGIAVDGMGNAAGRGNGAGAIYGGGGSYGGMGGPSATNQIQPGGNAYGTVAVPIDPGSGGANGAYSVGGLGGGSGGGLFYLDITGTLQLDGRLSANGTPGLGQGSGGGSGGSIYVRAGTLAGSGGISANGGAGNGSGGGGGGGRLALYYWTNRFTGQLTATGGAGFNYGGAGTIYLQQLTLFPAVDPYPQLILDNGGAPGARTPLSAVATAELTVRGGAVASENGSVTFANLSIGPNSWLVYTSAPAPAVLTVLANASIDSGGGISLDGIGYAPGVGQGAGRTLTGSFGATGGGGGYGGSGGASFFGAGGGVSYGSLSGPNSWGSGGGSGAGSPSVGGAGGGALQVNVAGKLALDGRITARGTAGIGQASGGGSGGSLWLTVGSLTGSGLVSVDGGSGNLPFGGGGGGGRIAVLYSTNQFTGNFSARGGLGAVFGGAGTIYLNGPTNAPFAGPLVIVDNAGFAGGSSNTFLSIPDPSFDLVIKGGAVASGTFLSLRNLLVATNSWLTFPPASQRTLTVTGDGTVQYGGGITLEGIGFPGGVGPGAGRSSSSPPGVVGSGGGHGGYGGMTLFGLPGGSSYGSLAAPTDLGSGGGPGMSSSPYNLGGAGGGALHLTVTGTLTLDGQLNANGSTGLSQGSGGGSGGSLWLNVGRLSGIGSISANGGGGDLPYGGGGGGGQIVLSYKTNLFAGTVTAYGGAGAMFGGAGTIYFSPLQGQDSRFPLLLIDNGGSRGTNTPLSQFQGGADLTVTGGATAVPAAVVRNLLVTSNAWLQSPGHTALFLTVTANATIEAGGGIILDGQGNLAGAGPGRGTVNIDPLRGNTGSGGGYGGYGGSSIGNVAGGGSYGSIVSAADLGSGGGTYSGSGGAGGGQLHLLVSRDLVVDGRISAEGASASGEGGGGGSGGALWISARTISGRGEISVNGGAGEGLEGGGGGGGRVALLYTTNKFTGNTSAHGGSGAVFGGAGTIYSKATQANVGQVLVDNGGWPGTNTPIASAEPFNLTVTGNASANPSSPLVLGSLRVDGNGLLTHLGTQSNLDVTILGNVDINTNGAVSVDGKGYNGADAGPGAGQMTNAYSGGGGGYGGPGGAGSSGIPGGGTYGSAEQPAERGSRGGLFPVYTNFSQGGGAIRLKVGGTLSVNGRLSANGNAAVVDGSGGGAGGSLWVTARKLDGTGLILANGGAGEPANGGGGGGGRIALYVRTNLFAGAVAAFGNAGATWGGNGTVFLTNVIPAPQVIAQSPSGIIYHSVDTVDLTFDAPIAATSVFSEDAALDTPNGFLPGNSLIAFATSLNTVRVGFPVQNTLGFYQLSLGPGIEDIYGDTMAATYTGSFVIWPPTVSGHVTDTNGAPVPFVTLHISGGQLPVVTDINGAYSLEVLPDAPFTITPSRGASQFIPPSRDYPDGAGMNLTNQDFVLVTPEALVVAQERQGSNLKLSWFGINGVNYQVLASPDMISWYPYSDLLPGTNGPLNLALPLDGGPQMFFRFTAAY